MKHPSEADVQARITHLEATGQLDPGQAETLRSAFREEAAPNSRGAPPHSSAARASRVSLPNGFLQGDQTEEELRRAGRRTALQLGFFFGLVMGAVAYFAIGLGRGWLAPLPFALPGALLMGAFYGLAMHALLIRPTIERQINLRRSSGPLAAIPSADVGQCPTCRSEGFVRLTWTSPTLLHWVLNPGLAVNELVLGQRIPARMNRCVQCNGTSVDCDHCHRAIDGSVWSGKAAFGHWGGLKCPYCASPLPTLSNGLAFVVRLPITLLRALGGIR